MSSYLILALLAVVGGAAVVLQAQFMGVLDQNLGTIESVFITYGSGGLVVGLTMLALRGGNLAAWRTVPPHMFITGLLGLVIVGTIGYVTPRLGRGMNAACALGKQNILGAIKRRCSRHWSSV